MAVTSRSGEEGGVKREGSAVDEYRSPPSRVTFPDAALRMSGSSTTPPLLKLQVEESSESMNPNNMWQVYALGGFMVLRWMWARWRERNTGGRSEDSSA
ncbi:hypothetical protein IHE45_05G000700 [Dioscorea alata]|uniref:Uncharacterized protein n=1 Tax=Dioscorea alata TaxID=55571 RepID=A0ACB7VZ93_DIOAL|nr:hypothetical protein IHE45_05G000700 [Dioscorea alata]